MQASLADCCRACVFSMLGIHFRLMNVGTQDYTWNDMTIWTVMYVLILDFLISILSQLKNFERLLEIFVGIICACTPAAAKSYDHHVQNLSTLKTIFTSQLSKIGSSTKQSQASLSSRQGDHHPGQYSNTDICQGPRHIGKARTKDFRTF